MQMLLQKKQVAMIGRRLHLITVTDGESRVINGRKLTFFDIQSTKVKQFGFTMETDGKPLVCCGDEPFNECERKYAENCSWLLHEAFCLNGQADIFHPYEKNHSTVKDAAELAESLHAEHLLLYHTEDKNILRRKELYTAEAAAFFHGKIHVPDDLETLEI